MKAKPGQFKKVAVLKGGPSSERSISLKSGTAVAGGLRAAGYDVIEVDVTGRSLELPEPVDAVFVALHGEFGEDGQIQALLEARHLPYTGSGPNASRISFDKRLSKAVFVQAGIPTAPYETLGPAGHLTLPLPIVVKPPCQGSTIGIFKVSRPEEWAAAFRESLRYDGEIIAEAFIPGRELTVGIVGQTALPAIEILAPDGWYDFDAKYSKGHSRHLCPAPLDQEIADRARAIALHTFNALGCRGLGRVDFRLTESGELFVLELNNIPGFTETSLLPEAALAAGIGFPELCRQIMEMATLESKVSPPVGGRHVV
ncbi:MAG: D-alanine--D-alanine ligase [bacterium]